jgi:group I intron endonuclease
MFYILYKTTNLINGMIYIGVHKTSNITDEYLGSGNLLRHAIKKYGPENFTREILMEFENEEDMYAAEMQLVDENFVARDDTYNIKVGGYGGFTHINSENRQFYTDKAKKTIEGWSDEYRKYVNNLKSRKGEENGMYGVRRFGEAAPTYGKIMSEETKSKISEANKGKVVCRDKDGNYLSVYKDDERIQSGEIVFLNTGRKHSEETKVIKSEWCKKNGHRPPSAKGLLWWNDGTKEIRAKEQPEGFIRGRIN